MDVEFCAFLPGVGADEAARIAERIRAAVSALDLGDSQRVIISVGVAVGEPAQAEDVEFVLALTAADKALLTARAEGRNTTRVELIGQSAAV